MEDSSSSSLDGNLRLDMYAVLVALGLAALLATCFWRLYKLTVSARPQDMLPIATPDSSCPDADAAAGLKGALRQQQVAALPVFVVRGASASVECAVCLTEIGDGERGRLLPRVRPQVPRRVHRPVAQGSLHVPALPRRGRRRAARRRGDVQGRLCLCAAGGAKLSKSRRV